VHSLAFWVAMVHWHAPPLQASLFPQTFPHVPQLLRSVETSVQVPLQLVWPDAQRHVPLLQFEPFLHSFPHVPQLSLSVEGLLQLPLQQLAGHVLPHPPQFFGSVAVSTHVSLHTVCDPVHVGGGTQQPSTQLVSGQSPFDEQLLLVPQLGFHPYQTDAIAALVQQS
jgi:hypothetical protein